jgi:hypothetical protein
MYFRESTSVASVEFDWELKENVDWCTMPVYFVLLGLIKRDSIAELTRSRATHATRWALAGQYAAFMSERLYYVCVLSKPLTYLS